jgi:hypothetical protein
MRMRELSVGLVLFALLGACRDSSEYERGLKGSHAAGASADTVPNGAGGTGAVTTHGAGEPVRACSWPSSLAALDANTRDVCRAARAFLSCDTNGGGVECASDDFSTCAAGAAVESPLKNCRSNCEATEYVALCGGIGPGPVPEPPMGCRFEGANPGGVAYYCCRCG